MPVFLAVLVAALALAAAAGARGGETIEVQITECNTGTEEGCEPEQPPAPEGSGGESQPPGGTSEGSEVHDVDLGSDSTHVTGSDGSESVTLDLDGGRKKKGEGEAAVPEAPVSGGAGRKRDRPDRDAPDTSGAVNMPVSTSGGQFTPGAAFDYVSTDEALSSFAIPPFLLPIYISAGLAYDVPWNVLASINQIETDFGRLGACAVSYAGAQGWMQFMPPTWDAYGVDASGDGVADPCNPVDAIYAAANYLDASGASADLRAAVYAYNHADWYVDRVLATAGVYGSLPAGLVSETASLAFGRFPVHGEVSYGDDFQAALASGDQPVGLSIYPSEERARAVATQDVTVTRILLSPGLADAMRRGSEALSEELAAHGPRPDGPSLETALSLAQVNYAVAEATGAPQLGRVAAGIVSAPLGALAPLADAISGGDPLAARTAGGAEGEKAGEDSGSSSGPDSGSKNPSRPDDGLPRGFAATRTAGIGVEVRDPGGNRYRYSGLAGLAEQVRVGDPLAIAQTIGPLRTRERGEGRPMLFETIAAAGTRVDPRKLVEGYRLLETASYYNAVEPIDGNPFVPDESFVANAAGTVSGTQQELAKRVLADPGISIYECGREDVARGIVDARILGALLYLREAGLTLTVTSLRCGHGYYTAGGSVSAHSYGAAVDIAAFNGQSVLGNQGPGSLTEQAIKLLMALDGEAQPSQLISLMSLGGPSFALSDHHDHLHVGFSFEPSLGLGRSGDPLGTVSFDAGGPVPLGRPDGGEVEKGHERALSDRFGSIENPDVRSTTGPGSVSVEGEHPDERSDADRLSRQRFPVELTPLAFGAEPVAVDVPARAKDGEAYALGVVDGTSRGWSSEQVVVLAHGDGAWAMVGAPQGQGGKVVNPTLTDLAAGAGGEGYAVGPKGTVVKLRGAKPPVLLKRETKADLRSVAVEPSGRVALATGPSGELLRIDGRRQSTEEVATGAGLSDIAIGAQGTAWVTGSRAGEPLLLSSSDGTGWNEVPLDFGVAPDAAVRLTSVAVRDGALLVGGAIAEQATIGSPVELPFAALREGGAWKSFCSVDPALAAIQELGEPRTRPCDGSLAAGGGERGAASAVALGGRAAAAATGGSLQVLETGSGSFEPVPAGASRVTSLALDSGGYGWATGPDGQLVRVEPRSGGRASQERSTQLPMAGDGLQATVAADPSGGRALAISGGIPAVLAAGEWRRGTPLGLGVREAAWARPGSAWAIDDSGALLELRGSEWGSPVYGWAGPELRKRLIEMTGSGALRTSKLAGLGLEALAFRSPGEGYAVGGGGLTLRFAGLDGWEVEPPVTAANLNDVASGAAGTVAVGDGGTLLERGDGRWEQAPEVALMVDGGDLTAAASMGDGTMLAAGAGAVLEREQGNAWRLSALPPLGQAVERIAGYRDDDGGLRAVALVREGGARYLVAGSAAGWTPVAPPAGMTVADFAPRPGTRSVWVAGSSGGGPAVAELDLAASPVERAPDGGDIEAAGMSLLDAVGDSFRAGPVGTGGIAGNGEH